MFALLEWDALRRLAVSVPQVRRLAHLPVVERDLAVVVNREVPAADVERQVAAYGYRP